MVQLSYINALNKLFYISLFGFLFPAYEKFNVDVRTLQSLSSFLMGNITLWFFKENSKLSHALLKRKSERKKVYYKIKKRSKTLGAVGAASFPTRTGDDPQSTGSVALPRHDAGWVGARRRWTFPGSFSFGQLAISLQETGCKPHKDVSLNPN